MHGELQQQYIAASAQVDTLKSRIAVLEADITDHVSAQPALEMRGAELEGEVSQYEGTYSQLSQSYQNLKISDASQTSNVRVLTQARENSRPVSPNIPRSIGIYGLLGLLLSIGVVALLEVLDDRIHSQESIQRESDQPILAFVPMVPMGTSPLLLTTAEDRNNPMLEGMRLLRSNLTYTSLDKGMRVIAVTSPGAKEGKSTMAVNLAMAMAMDGKRVVLLDADLRRPSLHRLFGLSREVGFTNVVTGTFHTRKCHPSDIGARS